MADDKIFDRAKVSMQIVQMYSHFCSSAFCKESVYYKKYHKRRKVILNELPYNFRSITWFPKYLMSFSDIKDSGIFIGYSVRERKDVFTETMTYAGFNCYSKAGDQKKYYGLCM